jgi:hypothetical protein
MADKLKLTGKELKGLLKRVQDEKTLTPEERELISEILKDSVRIGLLKVQK